MRTNLIYLCMAKFVFSKSIFCCSSKDNLKNGASIKCCSPSNSINYITFLFESKIAKSYLRFGRSGKIYSALYRILY